MPEMRSHVSRPAARTVADNDVVFFIALGFVAIALAVAMAVRY